MIKETDGDHFEDMRSLDQELTFCETKKEFQKRNITLEQPQMKTLGIINQDGIYTNLALLLSDQCVHTIKTAVFEGKKNILVLHIRLLVLTLSSLYSMGVLFLFEYL